jgi:dihydroorotate dehydrogenase
VSIGKQKETPIEDAAEDYLDVLRQVHHLAGYLAINVSSPNTPELRNLQQVSYLSDLLRPIAAEAVKLRSGQSDRPLPLFVKIAPDLSLVELDSILDILLAEEVDAVIATNTTINRAGLLDRNAGEVGGLSGRPLTRRSNEIIAYIYKVTNGTLPIIGAGGVFNTDDVLRKLDAGASLVQMYTGLIYEGPGIAGRILRNLQG